MGNYLGQHFLKNKAKLQKIVEALELKRGDVVIEIGSGKGALTDELRIKNNELRIIAIEKDKNLAEFLREKYKDDKKIEIIQGDALKILPQIVSQFPNFPISNYKIVGNIPYYITGYLFRILGELEHKPETIVLLIQKEVAERVCAKKGDMNLLAASIQFWAEPKIIGYVSKKDFSPPPKVESAIIKLMPITFQLLSRLKCNKEDYYKFIKILFKQPRKTVLNNIEAGIKNYELRISKEEIIGKLEKMGIKPNARPQDLEIGQIIGLSITAVDN